MMSRPSIMPERARFPERSDRLVKAERAYAKAVYEKRIAMNAHIGACHTDEAAQLALEAEGITLDTYITAPRKKRTA